MVRTTSVKRHRAVLPFGRDVLLFLRKGAEAVVSEERLPVGPDEAFDALAPPACVSEAAALEHQGPGAKTAADGQKEAEKCLQLDISVIKKHL